MIKGKANFIIDAHFGSSGKGKMSTWLADHFGATDVSSSNGPNAGHTAVLGDVRFVAKVLPTPMVLARSRTVVGWLSPESYFTEAQLHKELCECAYPIVYCHERAGVVTDEHAARERTGSDSTAHVASTMQGTATAMCDKLMRRPAVRLARDLNLTGGREMKVVRPETFARELACAIRRGTHLHEISQGWALGVNYGLSYPYCTSRPISTSKALDDLSLPPSMCGDVYLNLRTFPIRVGNLMRDGVEVGHSGPFFNDSDETTWQQIGENAGMPSAEIERLHQSELTTVTKRLRRVSTFPWDGLQEIVRVNGATKLCLNFAQYLDWRDAGVRYWNQLSPKTKGFVHRLEDCSGIPVVLIGTGADHHDVVERF